MATYYNSGGIGPWYEYSGPDAKYIRNKLFEKFKNFKDITDEELKKILEETIPDSKNDFGSWKGYAIFGIEEKLFNNIKKNIKILIEEKKIKHARKILNDKFVPFVIHKLYEPKGFMTKVISKRTNIGKAKKKLHFQ
tara:strand:- start:76 stop:486 length:411 start_codon:yes stop_codon:yes gene_type:complete